MLLVSEELKTLEAMMRKGGKKKYKVCSSNGKKLRMMSNVIAKEDN